MLHKVSEAFFGVALIATASIHGNTAIFHGRVWTVTVDTAQTFRSGKIIVFFVVHYFLSVAVIGDY